MLGGVKGENVSKCFIHVEMLLIGFDLIQMVFVNGNLEDTHRSIFDQFFIGRSSIGHVC